MKVVFDEMVEARFYGSRTNIKDFVYELACYYSACGCVFQSTLLTGDSLSKGEEIVFGRFEQCYVVTIEKLAEKHNGSAIAGPIGFSPG